MGFADFDASQAAGSLVGGGLSLIGGSSQTSANKAAQLRQQRFQKEMYETRYQMTMADMEKAGLNPILAYQQGVGSAPAGGSMAAAPNILQGAAASAEGYTRLKRSTDILKIGKRKAKAEVFSTWAQEKEYSSRADLNRQLADKAKVDTEVSRATAARTRLEVDLGKTGLPAARSQEMLDRTKGGEMLRQINRVIRSVTGRDSTGARR